ncbi:hypothetical protein [Wenyingzhuangia sp. IMCC45574]
MSRILFNIKKSLFVAGMLLSILSFGQEKVKVQVNLNVKHTVGGIAEFDRSKFITIHAGITEGEWEGDNFTSDLRSDFLEKYDVYLGRATGGISSTLRNAKEDASRKGFVDPIYIRSKGEYSKKRYATKPELQGFEYRTKNFIIAAQLHPFWTGESQKPTRKGWKVGSPTASGEYMGRFINSFYGGDGLPTPEWVEVINEPAYEALGGKNNYTNSLQEIADFHVEVADAVKAQNPKLKIGGYTVAFPDFETGNFQRWINRDKLFIDVAGEKMDFWSWHLYDFPAIGKRVDLRSGSNLEATFDMNDQYSMMKLGHTKPYVISEYGAQVHNYKKKPYSSYRDWLFLRAQNGMLMSFLERPQSIAIALPYTMLKQGWAFNKKLNIPSGSRLLRRENEPESNTGQWVYTERVKFYQLWKNVNGTRVDSYANDPDIQVDAYVDGKKGYVIINNLEFQSKKIQLDVLGLKKNKVTKIIKKHLWLNDKTKVPVLDNEVLDDSISEIEIGAGATMILEYKFKKKAKVNEIEEEVKYFADSYLKPIEANKEVMFHINKVAKQSEFGEVVLRVSIGRDHGSVLQPKVTFNNTEIDVPDDYRGYDQKGKHRFFGTLEIPISYDLLKENNEVKVSFPDAGGHVSSVTMQVFSFSKRILRNK